MDSGGVTLLCVDCAKELKVTGFSSVNEVGRKYCEKCGTNEDCLLVISEKDHRDALKRQTYDNIDM